MAHAVQCYASVASWSGRLGDQRAAQTQKRWPINMQLLARIKRLEKVSIQRSSARQDIRPLVATAGHV